MKIIFVILAVVLGAGRAMAGDDAQAVVYALFDAMRAGDGAAVRALVVPDARLDRLRKDGTLHQGNFEAWASWVDQQAAGDADEQIFGVRTLSVSPELATVWAPFTVTYKGELVGCGVNQFTLAK